MTTIFASLESDMDLAHLDDKMEVGTSPFPEIDDVDFDFEPPREQSVDRSMADDTDLTGTNADEMQAEADEIYKDDHMFDDDGLQQNQDDHGLEDLNMEPYVGETIDQHDEDILYDEEDTGSFETTEHRNIENVEPNETLVEHENIQEHGVQISESLEISDQDLTNIAPPSGDIDENAPEHAPATTIEMDEQTDALHNAAAQTAVIDFAAHGEDGQATAQGSVVQTDQSIDSIPAEDTSKRQEQEEPYHDDRSFDDETSLLENTEQAEEFISKIDQIGMIAMRSEDHTTTSAQSLHPVTVSYLGQEMSFFPPMIDDSSATFFLSDSNLANEPVESLLLSCREILGETLEHDDELVLDVPSLGLHICEDSKYASQITLSQVIDVYLTFSRNEKLDKINPLYCVLTSRVCLASQYTYLAACASEGKTYSEIAADYVDSPESGAEELAEVFEDQSAAEVVEDVSAQVPRDHEEEEGPLSQSHNEGLVNNSTGSVEAAGVEVESNDTHPDEALSAGVVEIENESLKHDDAEDVVHVSDLVESYAGPTIEIQDDAESKTVSPASEHQAIAEAEEQIDIGDQAENQNDEEIYDPETHFYIESNSTLPVDGGVLPVASLPEDGEKYQDETNPDHLSEEGAVGENAEGEATDHQLLENELTQNDDVYDAVNGHAYDGAQSKANENSESDELALEATETDSRKNDPPNEDDEFDLFTTDDITAGAPVTPSKPNGSKRKALGDEDELDFLDFDTPEPKRTRSS